MQNKLSRITYFMFILFVVCEFSACSQQSNEKKLIAEAQKIHAELLTIDSHTDTPLWFVRGYFDLSQRHNPREHGSKLDFPRMIEGGLDGVFFAAFIGQGPRTPEGNQKAFEQTERIFDSIHTVINRLPQLAEIATSPEDAVRLEKEGKRAIFIGVENGYAIGNDISLVKYFYNRGARYITLCHTKNNDISDSANDTIEFDGLSDFGKQVIQEMNRTGMMVDVSHISDKAFYDVIELSQSPVIASHSSARAVCDNPRNLNDDMLKKLAKNGGVVQVCNLSSYVKETPPNPQRDSARNALREKYNNFQDLTDDEMKIARQEWYAVNRQFPPNIATLADYVDHIDHIVKVAGIDHVGIGTDFDGGGGVEGNFDVSEMPNITIELLRRGYSKTDIGKIWSGNLLRVMKEVEKVAKEHKS
jgi:membrane dipeptidase